MTNWIQLARSASLCRISCQGDLAVSHLTSSKGGSPSMRRNLRKFAVAMEDLTIVDDPNRQVALRILRSQNAQRYCYRTLDSTVKIRVRAYRR